MTRKADDLRDKLDRLAGEIVDSALGSKDVEGMANVLATVGSYYVGSRKIAGDDSDDDPNVVTFRTIKQRARLKRVEN